MIVSLKTTKSSLEYYLEDAIQMLGFVPPLKEKKKKRDADVDVEEEVLFCFSSLFLPS